MKAITKLLTLLMFVCLANCAKAQSVEHMLKDWERAKNFTKEYLDSMPEAGYAFKPTPEMRSFAEQMLHFTDANFELASLARGVKNPIGDGAAGKLADKSKVATTKMVMDGYDFVIAVIKNMKPEQFKKKIKLFDKYEMTNADVINKIFEHQTHHRGQTTVYLRLQGVVPPSEKLF